MFVIMLRCNISEKGKFLRTLLKTFFPDIYSSCVQDLEIHSIPLVEKIVRVLRGNQSYQTPGVDLLVLFK